MTWDGLPIGTVFKRHGFGNTYTKVEKYKVLSSLTNTMVFCGAYEIYALMDSKLYDRIFPDVSPRKPIKWI